MSFKLTLADRLDYLAHVGPGVQDVFNAYERPFAEQRVIGPDGQTVPDISPTLREAQKGVMQAVQQFEAVAAHELASLEGRKSL